MNITTDRLVLRKFNKDDVFPVHALFCDEEAMRLVGMYPPFTQIEETRERVTRWGNMDKYLAIVLKEKQVLIGYIVINSDSEENREDTRELGFALISKYRRKGYMKEAINAVLNELSKSKVRYVWACCFKENSSSEKLIRSIGFEFQQEGIFKAPNDRQYDSYEFRIRL